MDFLLFVIYLFLFAWLVTKTRFFTATGLSTTTLLSLFLLKVIAGIFYGWMGTHYSGTAQMVDTWNYHAQGIKELEVLFDRPTEYFTNLFHNPYPGGYSKLFASSGSFWNDLKSNIFIKFLSILDLFSQGRYYVNVIFFAYLTLFGPLAIFRVMKEQFPRQEKWILAAIFLCPSFLYWSSGIHKEGLLFLGISLIIYHVYFTIKEKRISGKRTAGVFLGLFLLFTLRNAMLIIVIPALIAWIAALRWNKRIAVTYGIVYLIFFTLFFTLRYVNPRLDFPQAVVEKQQAFVNLVGYSSIPIRSLEPTAVSFLINLPQALSLSALRPYPSDIRHLPSLFSALETALILILLLLFIFFKRPRTHPPDAVLYFTACLSFTLLLVVGFSVNNLGAIVRYRSIVLPLILIPVMAGMDWKRLFGLFSNSKVRTEQP